MKMADTDADNITDITNWNFADPEGIKQKLRDCIHCSRLPTCFQCGDIVVEAEYAKDGPKLFSLVEGIVRREIMK